jgi:TRAP-type C4-dicarboxylate transport system substrate-binding protein
MDIVKTRGRRTLIGALAATAVVAAACGADTSGGDKAGGAGEPVILRMADTGSSLSSNLSYVPAVEAFVQRVTELSAGHLRIDMADNTWNSAPDAEQQVVRDVAAGKADLTYVGARAFDTLSVTSFRALQAPLLIDSYALEDAVIKSAMPSQMLDGLKTLGVSGLGMLGGGMLKPLAAERPLLSPADWRGITFQTYRSRDGADAIRALGATPTDTLGGLDAGLDDGSIQGFARSLLTYQINGSEDRAPFVTANVNLWPNMIVLVANPASLSRLTDEQRGWLHQAAADAAAGSRTLVDREDEILMAVCTLGAHAANASDADLAALRQAFDPVYSRLEQDPQTKAFIGQIRSLKQSLPANPPMAIPAGCTAPGPAPSVLPPTSDPLVGSWTTAKLTQSEVVRAFVAAGGDEKEAHAFFAQLGKGGTTQYAEITLTFQDGLFIESESADGGPSVNGYEAHYDVANDSTLRLDDPRSLCLGTYRYDLQGDTLQLQVVKQCSQHDAPYNSTLFATFPFTRSN